MRPIVIALMVVGIVWSMAWAIEAFQDLGIDKSNIHGLVIWDIVLGAMYSVIALIAWFGLIAAVTQKLQLVRLFTLLTLVAALLTVVSSILRIILHFTFKNGLINECIGLVTGTINGGSGLGFWGSVSGNDLSPADASTYSNDSWNHDTFSVFVWFIASAIVTFLTCGIVYGYYNQLLDPTSVASRYPRAPSNQYRMNAFPTAYNPAPYDSQFNARSYAPPPGPPPTDYVPAYDAHKLPGYGASSTDLQAGPPPEKE